MRSTSGALLLVLALATQIWAAATYDNNCTAAFTTTTSTNCSVTIADQPNRAILATVQMQSNGATSISCSGGSASGWALVSGTDSGTARTVRSLIWAAVAPATGSQTITCSWTNNITGRLGVVSAYAADQTTPMINGTFNSGTNASASVTITSASGDLTIDSAVALTGHALSAPTQTQIWLTSPHGQSRCTGSASTCVHAWSVGTSSGRQWVNAGARFANFLADIPVRVVQGLRVWGLVPPLRRP